MTSRIARLFIAFTIVTLAGCGGGSSARSGGVTPAGPTPKPTGSPGVHPQFPNAPGHPVENVTFRLNFSEAGQQTVPHSIRLEMKGALLGTFDTTAASNRCTSTNKITTCAYQLSLPENKGKIRLRSYAQAGASGTTLEAGNIPVNVDDGGAIDTTLADVTAVTPLVIPFGIAQIGTPATLDLPVGALDKDGATIVGSYSTPLTVTDVDQSGATKLSLNGGAGASKVTLTSSADNVSILYDGRHMGGAATIAAQIQGTSAQSSTIFIPNPTQVAVYRMPVPAGATYAHPIDIVNGPDSNLWMSYEAGSGNGKNTGIAMMSTGGQYRMFKVGAVEINGIAASPRGSSTTAWFTVCCREFSAIGSIDSSGKVVQYPVPKDACGGNAARPKAITADASSSGYWFTLECSPYGSQVAHVTNSGNFTLSPQIPGLTRTGNILAGVDGKLYVSGGWDASSGYELSSTDDTKLAMLYRLAVSNGDTANVVDEYRSRWPNDFSGVAQYPDGTLWAAGSGSAYGDQLTAGVPWGYGGSWFIPTLDPFEFGAPVITPEGSLFQAASTSPFVFEKVDETGDWAVWVDGITPSPGVQGAFRSVARGDDGYLYFADETTGGQTGEINKVAY